MYRKIKNKIKTSSKKAVKYILDNRTNGLLLIHPPGSGKTLTAVTISQCFLDKFPNRKVIFIGPANLLDNFKKELKAYGVFDQKHYKFYSFQKFLQIELEERDKNL